MAKKKFVKKYLEQSANSHLEPDLSDIVYNGDGYSKVLNWYYQTEFDAKTQKQWVVEYTGDDDLKSVDDKLFVHPFTTVCRLGLRGMKLEGRAKEIIQENVDKLKSKIEEKKAVRKQAAAGRPTIQDRMKEQATPAMAEVDFFVDEKLAGREHDLRPALNGLGGPQTRHVIKHIQSYIDEYQWVKDAKLSDKELFKSYGLTIRQINNMQKYLTSLIDICQKWIDANKSTTRKKRKVKIKTPEQICAKVQVSKDTIIKPTKIIGKKMLIVYNAKYNKLRVFHAVDAEGLSIKGTTIIGYSEIKSEMYTVKAKHRDTFLKKFVAGKIDGLNKMKREMNSDKYRISKGKMNGRLNKEVSILAVA